MLFIVPIFSSNSVAEFVSWEVVIAVAASFRWIAAPQSCAANSISDREIIVVFFIIYSEGINLSEGSGKRAHFH